MADILENGTNQSMGGQQEAGATAVEIQQSAVAAMVRSYVARPGPRRETTGTTQQ